MNASRDKGTRWATAITDYLRSLGWPHAERRVLFGPADRGDITGIPGVVIEAKNASRLELAEWVKEAEREGRNADAAIAVVWAHARGKASPGDGYVIMTGRQFTYMLRESGY